MHDSILVPTDGSEHARMAASPATAKAERKLERRTPADEVDTAAAGPETGPV